MSVNAEATALDVRAVPVRNLSDDLYGRWLELHGRADPAVGPFLHPAYAAVVAEVRTDVEVGVVRRSGEPVGFLPFQRSRLGVGSAVGARLCDLASVLLEPGIDLDASGALERLGLRSLRFPHVPVDTPTFGPHEREVSEAHYIDLRDGYDAFRAGSLESGSRLMKQIDRRARSAEDEVGPLRVEWHTSDEDVFRDLVEWKSAQRRATRTPDVLALPWAADLVDRVRSVDRDGFGGVLFALYLGDHLAAAHLGIRSEKVLHYWIPAYSLAFSDYSPGLLALDALAEAAAERGIERIDLGVGDERYKRRVGNGSFELARVQVSRGSATRAVSHGVERVRRWSKTTSTGRSVRDIGRAVVRAGYSLKGALGRAFSNGSTPNEGG